MRKWNGRLCMQNGSGSSLRKVQAEVDGGSTRIEESGLGIISNGGRVYILKCIITIKKRSKNKIYVPDLSCYSNSIMNSDLI